MELPEIVMKNSFHVNPVVLEWEKSLSAAKARRGVDFMYIVHSTFAVPDDKAEEVISIYHSRSGLVDEAEGFQRFLLLQNEKKPGEITVHMEWDTKEHFMTWIQSEDYKRIHELEKKYPDKDLASIIPSIDKYKVVAY
jgi:heme oxygenase (mycobilin-producing)